MTATDRNAQADALLGALQRERGGQLKVFLGAAPGVGKTYAMLSAARELHRQGIDIVVGLGTFRKDDCLGCGRGRRPHAVDLLAVGVGAADHA